jgi:hypothetical protein
LIRGTRKDIRRVVQRNHSKTWFYDLRQPTDRERKEEFLADTGKDEIFYLLTKVAAQAKRALLRNGA